MEKRTPHCRLAVVKALIEADKVRATATAFSGARELGINNLSGICAVVMALAPSHFYKSMTTDSDHRIWQDVYRIELTGGCQVYVKLTVIEDVLVVSFKEL